jgi:hypothetical protein
MTTPKKLGSASSALDQEQIEFIGRLADLAAKLGSKAALARKAEIPLSSLDSYFNGTEPPRRVLIRLTEATNTSLEWLLKGQGEKDADAAPEGYVWIIYFDLRMSGPHIRAINFITKRRLLIKKSPLYGAEIDGPAFAIGGAEEGLDFPPEVRTCDTLLIGIPRDHEIEHPTMIEAWPIRQDAVYLVADGAQLKLRKLRRNKDETLSVVTADGTVESKLAGAPRNFILYGRVVWRSGVLPS